MRIRSIIEFIIITLSGAIIGRLLGFDSSFYTHYVLGVILITLIEIKNKNE